MTTNIILVPLFHLSSWKIPINSKCNTQRWGREAGENQDMQECYWTSITLAALHRLVELEHSHSHLETWRSCPARYTNLRRKYWRQSLGLTSLLHLWPCGNPASSVTLPFFCKPRMLIILSPPWFQNEKLPFCHRSWKALSKPEWDFFVPLPLLTVCPLQEWQPLRWGHPSCHSETRFMRR